MRSARSFRPGIVVASTLLLCCGADADSPSEASAPACEDARDNDADGFVDCDDQDCATFCSAGDGDADADGDGDGDTDADSDGDGDGDADGEVCNGLDDDGDLEIDEGDPGAGVRCLTGLDGRCEKGSTSCKRGAIVCIPDATIVPETCANPGTDDDCNGLVDDIPDLGLACATGLGGRCRDGTWACVEQAFTCLADAAEPEPFCPDGIDHDCDGQADDGEGPVAESCANLGADDDCNGAVDDIPGRYDECDTGLEGQCAAGQLLCVDVSLECVQSFEAREEECDTFQDEDCDGQFDEADCIDPFIHHTGWGQTWREEGVRTGAYDDQLAEHACLEYVAANPGAVGPDGSTSCIGYWDCWCADGSHCFRTGPADPDWPWTYWYYDGPLVGTTTDVPCVAQFTWD